MDRSEEALQAFEPFFAFNYKQVILVTLSRVIPAARNQSSASGEIFLSY
jgi:hypothetical protein